MEVTEGLHNVSLAIFNDLSGILYAVLPIDALTACMTFLEFAALVLDRQIRVRKSFLLIIVLLFGYFLSACGSMISVTAAIAMRLLQGDCVISQRKCICLELMHSVGYLIVTDISFLLAVDRTLAIVMPVWYNKDYKDWLLHGQLMFVLFHFLFINISIYVSSKDEHIPYCTLISDVENKFLIFEGLSNNVLLALTLTLYVTLIAWVKFKLYQNRQDAVLQVRRQQQMKSKLLLTLAGCMFIHAATFYVGTLVGTFAMAAKDIQEAMSLAKYGVLLIISGPMNAIFLWCRTREIRSSIVRLIMKSGFSRIIALSSKVFPYLSQPSTMKTPTASMRNTEGS